MRVTVDTEQQTLTVEQAGCAREHALYSREAFEILSAEWLKLSWDRKYSYTFTWLGRPIIQLPEDILRVQEVIYKVKPDVIIETGVAHGGSLILYASLAELIGRGRVIGVDVTIRPHNREAIQKHELASRITLIEGDSAAPATVDKVRQLVHSGEMVLVLLDSDHSKQHVLRELEAYAPLVSPGSYIIAADGIMQDVALTPRARADWQWNNPMAAAAEFASTHPEFVLAPPLWAFNESELTTPITHCPGGWLRRL
jgi:cephalosporin hydroxylase